MTENNEHPIWIVLALFLTPLTIFVGGVVTKTLWWWFLVPLGVSGIGTAHAVGISCLFSWFNHSSNDKSALASLITFAFKLAVIMLVAYIAKSCM